MKKLLMATILLALISCKQSTSQESVDPAFQAYAYLDDIEYGFIEVPEDRELKNGKKIRLAYMVLKAGNGSSEKDPILHLQGGPGGSTLIMANFWANNPLRDDRDIVLMDQRGTGASNPLCPGLGNELMQILAENLRPEAEKQRLLEASKSCVEWARVTETSLGAYNSRENAADFEALRKELGYSQWNLFGGSYGSRLGLTIMRDFPKSVRAAMLFSIFAPENDLYSNFTSDFANSLFQVLDQCKRDPNCNRQYPDLKTRFSASLQRIKDEPLSFSYNGNSFYLNPQDVLLLMHQMLYNRTLMGFVPIFIEALETGDEDVLRQAFEPTRRIAGLINFGMYLSVMAYEELPFTSETTYQKDLLANPELESGVAFFNSDLAIMKQWHKSRAAKVENLAVRSKIPTLICNGSLDPITPPRNARQLEERLEKAYFFEFSNEGHSFMNDCFIELCRSFLDQPDQKPTSDCNKQASAIPWN